MRCAQAATSKLEAKKEEDKAENENRTSELSGRQSDHSTCTKLGKCPGYRGGQRWPQYVATRTVDFTCVRVHMCNGTHGSLTRVPLGEQARIEAHGFFSFRARFNEQSWQSDIVLQVGNKAASPSEMETDICK